MDRALKKINLKKVDGPDVDAYWSMEMPYDDWGDLANWSIQQDLVDKQDSQWLENKYFSAYLQIQRRCQRLLNTIAE